MADITIRLQPLNANKEPLGPSEKHICWAFLFYKNRHPVWIHPETKFMRYYPDINIPKDVDCSMYFTSISHYYPELNLTTLEGLQRNGVDFPMDMPLVRLLTGCRWIRMISEQCKSLESVLKCKPPTPQDFVKLCLLMPFLNKTTDLGRNSGIRSSPRTDGAAGHAICPLLRSSSYHAFIRMISSTGTYSYRDIPLDQVPVTYLHELYEKYNWANYGDSDYVSIIWEDLRKIHSDFEEKSLLQRCNLIWNTDT